MTEAVSEFEIPPAYRERLVMAFHQKRASFLINYILGVAAFVMSLIFNTITAGLYIPYDLYSWLIGIGAFAFGIILVGLTEVKRRQKYYLITTWNVRIRTGVFKKTTTRIFYDEIDHIETTANPDERMVGMGDVEIYAQWQKDRPFLVIQGIANPDGIAELIKIMMERTPTPPPWNHIDRRAPVQVHH